MPRFELSEKATQDLLSIFVFGTERFGSSQAERYQSSLARTLDLLAHKPLIGRIVGEVDGQLRRHAHERHVIFYRQTPQGIFVVRVFPMARLKGSSTEDDLA